MSSDPHPSQPQGRPFWKSKSLIVAAVLVVVGLLWWMMSAAADATGSAATARLGASYIGGFVIGWAYRKSVKTAAMIAAGLVGVIALAKGTGLVNLNWASIEGSITSALAWLHGEAGALKDMLTGYLPDSGASVVGAFIGARKT